MALEGDFIEKSDELLNQWREVAIRVQVEGVQLGHACAASSLQSFGLCHDVFDCVFAVGLAFVTLETERTEGGASGTHRDAHRACGLDIWQRLERGLFRCGADDRLADRRGWNFAGDPEAVEPCCRLQQAFVFASGGCSPAPDKGWQAFFSFAEEKDIGDGAAVWPHKALCCKGVRSSHEDRRKCVGAVRGPWRNGVGVKQPRQVEDLLNKRVDHEDQVESRPIASRKKAGHSRRSFRRQKGKVHFGVWRGTEDKIGEDAVRGGSGRVAAVREAQDEDGESGHNGLN